MRSSGLIDSGNISANVSYISCGFAKNEIKKRVKKGHLDRDPHITKRENKHENLKQQEPKIKLTHIVGSVRSGHVRMNDYTPWKYVCGCTIRQQCAQAFTTFIFFEFYTLPSPHATFDWFADAALGSYNLYVVLLSSNWTVSP